jgi:hypothetical protein
VREGGTRIQVPATGTTSRGEIQGENGGITLPTFTGVMILYGHGSFSSIYLRYNTAQRITFLNRRREDAMEDQPKLSQTWRQKNKRLLILATFIILVLLLAFALTVYWLGWDWTGFTSATGPTLKPNEQYRPAKTLWDVLQLLIVPFILAIGGFWLNRIQKDREDIATVERIRTEQVAESRQRQAERDAESRQLLIQALLGEKESIGFTTLILSKEGLPQDVSYRGQILTSLVQAAFFSGSDRARGMVYSVLFNNYPKYKLEIDKIISSLDKMFKQMKGFPLNEKELDRASFELRLEALRKVLEKSTSL